MAWIASLANLPEGELDKYIKRLVAILLAGLVLFVGFYLFDRWRPATPSIVDRNIATFEAAVRDDPSDIVARGQLADAYIVAERYRDAIAQYDQILQTGKADELAHFGRARANEAVGDLNAAIADYEAVVDIAREGEMAHVDPMLNAAFYGLGSIALQQDRSADAIHFLEAAVAIKRYDADALYLLGQAYTQNGEPEKAIEPLRSAISFDPVWSEAYAALGAAYDAAGNSLMGSWAGAMAAATDGRYDDATATLEELLDGPAALDATIGLGLISEVQGDAAAATDWYAKALTIDPENAAARLGLNRVSMPDASPAAGALPTPGVGEGLVP